MKIYTNTFDLARISPHRFWVAPYSDFKIGVKIVKNGEAVANTFTVKAGSTTLTPDEDKIDGFTTYTLKSNSTGFVEYTIEVANVIEKQKLLQIVTDSTVFEVGGEGGGDVPADVATKTWVNSQISDFITKDALDGYATESYVASQISDFVTDDELTGYATKDELTSYVETGDLTAYYTKGETSSATEIGTALEGKQPIGNYLTEETEPAFAAMSADIVVDGDLTAYATKDELTAYAEKTDIKDSTITITQGGVTKGSFTLNQATGDTIELDAGGGGSSAISAFDLSESPVWSKTMVENAVANNICLPQTLVLNVDNSISVVDADNVLSVSHQNGLQTVNDFPNSKKIIVGTKVKTLYGHVRSDNEELVLPNTLTAFGSGASRMFKSNMKYTKIPDSVSNIDEALSYSSGTYTYSKVVDFGNTRTTVPSCSNINEVGSNINIYVPDALYDTWIATGSWSNISARIHRHSELEAPYATSTAVSALTAANSKVTGGAETGTTGTPAAVNAVKSVYETDWATLSATAEANTFYVVLPDPA